MKGKKISLKVEIKVFQIIKIPIVTNLDGKVRHEENLDQQR